MSVVGWWVCVIVYVEEDIMWMKRTHVDVTAASGMCGFEVRAGRGTFGVKFNLRVRVRFRLRFKFRLRLRSSLRCMRGV